MQHANNQANSHQEAVITSLIQALNDHRDGLRQFAVRRLVALGASAIPALIETLKSKNIATQESAAIALATMGPIAINHLIAAMRSPDREIRWGAAWVLASMGPEVRNAIPAVRPQAVEQRQPVSAADSGIHHGVWSDSWLTKVREKLEANRLLDVVAITNASLDPA